MLRRPIRRKGHGVLLVVRRHTVTNAGSDRGVRGGVPRATGTDILVAARDLPHVDIPALRRTSEELVVTLQSASAKLGLQRSTLEANLK